MGIGMESQISMAANGAEKSDPNFFFFFIFQFGRWIPNSAYTLRLTSLHCYPRFNNVGACQSV